MRLVSIAALAASLFSLSISASAFGESENSYPSFQSQKTPATGTIQTAAKVALYYSNNLGGIQRGIGVKKVTQPGTGIYCITTTNSAKLDPADIYPTVTVEWAGSGASGKAAPLNAMIAYIDQPHTDCGNDSQHTLEVKTYAFPGGTWSLSNEVGFYLTVQ
jgi:hypothetical protein